MVKQNYFLKHRIWGRYSVLLAGLKPSLKPLARFLPALLFLLSGTAWTASTGLAVTGIGQSPPYDQQSISRYFKQADIEIPTKSAKSGDSGGNSKAGIIGVLMRCLPAQI